MCLDRLYIRWILLLISIKNVNESIDALEPGDDDIVVFYYTGHGFRFEKQDQEEYPHVYLQPTLPEATTEIINENSVNLKEIFEKVKARGARLRRYYSGRYSCPARASSGR